MLNDLEEMISHFLKADLIASEQLGRSESKFMGLINLAASLPEVIKNFTDSDLASLAQSSSANLTPRSRACKDRTLQSKAEVVREAPATTTEDVENTGQSRKMSKPGVYGVAPLPNNLGYKRVDASRVRWDHSPSFDPTPFPSDHVVRAAFQDPDTLRLPSSQWPKLPPAQVHGARDQILALAKKWDDKQALCVIPAGEVDHSEAVGLFCVPKNQNYDRLILNPTTMNSRSLKYSVFTKLLAPGYIACGITLKPNEVLRLSADDLSEMYYTFQVPYKRAKRNAVRMLFQPWELKGFKAYNEDLHQGLCYVALKALAMGDGLAVEVAQQSHVNLLRDVAGALRPDEFACYRKPLPRGSLIELVSIDDHMTLQKVSRKAIHHAVRARDTEVFEKTEPAYKAYGLVQ